MLQLNNDQYLRSVECQLRKNVKKICRNVYFDFNGHKVVIDDEKNDLNYNEVLLLDYMLKNENTILDKRTLIKVGWPENVVTESSLNKSINRIRSIFESKKSVNIETITGKGYVLRIVENRALDFIYNKNFSIVIYAISFLLVASALYIYLTIPSNDYYMSDDYHYIEFNESDYNKRVILPNDQSLPPYILSKIEENKCDCTFLYITTVGKKYDQLSVYDPKNNDVVNFVFMEGEGK